MTKSVPTSKTSPRPNALTGRNHVFAGLLVAVIIVAGVSMYINSSSIAQAIMLATTRQPSKYTELSFVTSPTAPLPASAPVGVGKSFTFRMANHEAMAKTYAYTVTLQIGTTVYPVTTKSLTLLDGQASNQIVHFTMPVASADGLITVHLDNPDQNIFFRSQS